MSKVYTDNIEKRTGGTEMAVPATGKWPTANIADDAIGTAQLSATGTADSTTFLRGDNSWQDAGVSTFGALTDVTISASDPLITTNPAATGHYWMNKTTGECYISTDITTNENVWSNIGDGTGRVGPGAQGGTEVTSGGYKYHTFTASGNLVVTGTLTGIEYLVIAGGGSGGGNSTGVAWAFGGGGAGGYRSATGITLPGATYAVVVGAGGAGGDNIKNAGGVSSINSFESAGGGAGGVYNEPTPGRAGEPGGSGGGGAIRQTFGAGNTPSTSPAQGFPGGDSQQSGSSGDNSAAGGGGGATATTTDTAGGAGSNAHAVWATATSTGASGYYAGGGGGGRGTGPNGTWTGGSVGGSGGGGQGGNNTAGSAEGQDATANTGSGGGGGGGGSGTATGGNGASGIVIVRYAV
jgi:hypothetical protein